MALGSQPKVIARKISMSKVEIYKLFILISLVVNIFLGYFFGKHYDSHSEYHIDFMLAVAIWLFILRGIIYNINIQIVPKEKKDLANSDSFKNTSSSPSQKDKKKE